MRFSWVISKKRSSSRWGIVILIVTLSNLIFDIARSARESQRVFLLICTVFLIVGFCLWALLTIRLLIELGSAWQWVIPLAILYLIAAGFAFRGNESTMFVLVLAADSPQLPLLFLSPKTEGGPQRDGEDPGAGA